MTNDTYKALKDARIVRTYKCSRNEYDSIDPILRESNEPQIDGYKVYEEIEDEDELRLLLLAKQVGNTRAIRSMLTYFTFLSVLSILVSFIYWIIVLFPSN